MKKTAILSLGTLFIVGVFLFSTNGCGARGKVAVDNLVSAVDKMLGELKVKRQKISDKMEALEEGIKGIRKSKIETDVQREMLQKKVTDQKALQEKANENLKKVSELLKKAETESSDVVKTESGKEIKKDALKKYATDLIAQQKSITTKLKGFEEAEATLERVVKSLASKEKEYSATVVQLKQTLEQIDAKRTAVEAMQAASAKVDGNDNLKDSIAKLEKEIDDLNVTVETNLRLEDDKWAKSQEADDLKEAKEIIETSGGSADLIGEIDSLLNEK